jgi:hypothetical protein
MSLVVVGLIVSSLLVFRNADVHQNVDINFRTACRPRSGELAEGADCALCSVRFGMQVRIR